MKYLLRNAWMALLLISLAGCATVNSYKFGEAFQYGEPTEEKWVHLYLGYTVGKDHIATECPPGSKVVQFQSQLTPGQWWLGLPTLWIYSPITAKYWCE